MPEPFADATSIVLVGRFNPVIFQPNWLATHELIRKEEAEKAEGLVFAPEVAKFKAEWLDLSVTSERFQVLTEDPAHANPLRDLVLSIFQLLEHTPIEQMGINTILHYRLESVEKWHSFGHMLAPKEQWRSVFEEPGMMSLTMQGKRPGAPNAKIQVTIQPSVAVHPGVFFSTNEHYQATGSNVARQLMEQLASSWAEAQSFSRSIAEHLLSREY